MSIETPEPVTARTHVVLTQETAKLHRGARIVWRIGSVLLAVAGIVGCAAVSMLDPGALRAALSVLSVAALFMTVPVWQQGTMHADEATYWRGGRS